jgi:tetratricopeptide (TPR) repeat protein
VTGALYGEKRKQLMRIHLLLTLIVLLSGCQTINNKGQDVPAHVKAESNYKQGLEQAKNRNYQEAISSFESAIQQDKNYVPAYVALGGSYFTVLKFKEAGAQWEKAIALDPKSKEAYVGIGYLEFMDNKYDSAIRSFETAISVDPNFSAAHAAIGRVYQKQGLIDKAVAELEISIKLNPDEVISYWVLSQIYDAQGSPQKAEEYKNKALSIAARLHGNQVHGDSFQPDLTIPR